MNRFFLFLCTLLWAAGVQAQGVVRGRVLDRQTNEALQFVNVKLMQGERLIDGKITDANGSFNITGVADGQYVLTV